ncbi:hypothetical protein ACFQPF_00895 [Fictibacillus iocasae]|uniref:Uncharacterized protein n=1 Tax=Fictibacillus iocasae TaxID=2715437 RepID=A0ABW2NM79_9BACL
MKDFHCCATCVHFASLKAKDGMRYHCVRLQYETKPEYTFNCWDPKENVKQLMKKSNEKRS